MFVTWKKKKAVWLVFALALCLMLAILWVLQALLIPKYTGDSRDGALIGEYYEKHGVMFRRIVTDPIELTSDFVLVCADTQNDAILMLDNTLKTHITVKTGIINPPETKRSRNR